MEVRSQGWTGQLVESVRRREPKTELDSRNGVGGQLSGRVHIRRSRRGGIAAASLGDVGTIGGQWWVEG